MEKNVVEIIFSKICEELKRRLKGKHRDTNIAGVEIKLRRCAYNITLEELAKDICSISYLSNKSLLKSVALELRSWNLKHGFKSYFCHCMTFGKLLKYTEL